jgi:uncharacterized protein (TIRG00374 family)
MTDVSRRLRRVGLGLLGPLISAAAIVLVVQSIDLSETARVLGHSRFALLVPATVLVAVDIVLRALRWQRLLRTSAQPVPVRRIVPVLLIGYLGNAVLPARLGEPIRAYLLARREGLSSFEVLGTALLERILDVTVLALMAFLASWAVGAPAWVVQLTGIGAAGGIVLVLALTLVGLGPLVRLLERGTDRLGFLTAGSILSRLDRFARGFGGRSQRVPVGQAAVLSLLIWLIDTGICWLAGQSLGLNLHPAAALLIVAVGALGTSIPSAPAYVGTYELAASAAGRAVGLDAPTALSLAIVIHAVTMLPVALAGWAATIALGSGSLRGLADAATERGGDAEAGG